MENVMAIPQNVYEDVTLLKNFRDRSDGGQPWFMVPEFNTEIGDIFHITDKNKKKLFTVHGDITTASYICFLNNLLDKMIKEVESKYE